MITNQHKKMFSITSFIIVLFGLFAVLPLEVLLGRTTLEVKNIEIMELILKFIVLPILVILLTLYFIRVRCKIQNEQTNLPVSLIKMCYLPIAIYISGLLGWIGGVIYASIPFAENMIALLCIILAWVLSALLIILFGIYTDWLNNQSKKKFNISNIVYIVVAVLIIVGLFFGYKKVGVVEKITEINAFVQLAIYILAYFVMLLFLWKTIYSEETTVVVLEKDEEFTEEEKQLMVADIIEQEVLNDFTLYYEKNIGIHFEELKKYQGITKGSEDIEQNEEENIVSEDDKEEEVL